MNFNNYLHAIMLVCIVAINIMGYGVVLYMLF